MDRTDQELVRGANFISRPFILSLVAAGLISAPANAQNTESSTVSDRKFVTLLGIHSATVAPHGLVFGGVSRSFDLNNEDAEEDTSAVLGFGLGDANTGVGFQFSAFANSETDTFDSFGYLGVKASARLQSISSPTYVGLAVDRIAGQGAAEDVEEAASLMITRFDNFRAGETDYPVILTLGAGSHASDLSTEPGIFLGAGVGLSRHLGVSAAWNGEWVELGSGIKVSAVENLTITLSVADALNEVDRQQLAVGVSWFFDAGQWR